MTDEHSAHPTMLADRLGGGPHGLGDPDDRTLRKVEKDVLIPKVVKQRAKEKCDAEVKEFTECGQKQGLFMPFKCRKENKVMLECIVKWYQNKEFYQQCKEEYMKDRETYRRTGVPQKQKRKENII